MKKILIYVLLSLVGKFVVGHSQITFPHVIQGSEGLGICVHGEVDINQDGFNDLIATTLDMGPFIGGKVFVYSGKDFSTMYTFSHRLAGGNYGLTSIDANLDGFPDIVVPGMTYGNDDNYTEFVKVYSGSDGSELYQADLAKLKISSVNSISDLNSDGIKDILVGGFWNCVVISGKDGTVIYDLRVQSYYGVVLPLEDINGDSVPDIAVSSDRIGTGGENGTIYIFSGSDGSLIITITGSGITFGFNMASCPDIDNDGKEDLIISVPARDSAYVYSTGTGQALRGIAEPFGVPGIFGVYTGRLGDLDGDGYDDFVVTDVFASSENDWSWSGAVFIFSGADSDLLYSYYGVPYSDFGFSVTSLGDLNSDRRPEIAVGAPGESKIYVFSTYLQGDANQDGRVTLADVIVRVNYVFKSGPRPLPMSVADDNCDGAITISDILCAVNYIFKGQTQGCCYK